MKKTSSITNNIIFSYFLVDPYNIPLFYMFKVSGKFNSGNEKIKPLILVLQKIGGLLIH